MGDVRVITGPQAQALFPPLRAGLAAVHIPGAARVDGRKVTDALIRAAQRNGATVRAGDAALACRAGRAAGVLVGGDLIEADAVVAATGAWTPAFVEPAGITVRVTPQRGQIVHLSLGSAGTGDWPVVLPAGSGHYLLAFDDSRVVVGATREPEAGFGYRVTAAGLSEVLAQALAVAPGLGAATYLETRVGFRPAGPGHPAAARPGPGRAGPVRRHRAGRRRAHHGSLRRRHRRARRSRPGPRHRPHAVRPAALAPGPAPIDAHGFEPDRGT